MKIEGLAEEGYFLWEMAESYLYINGRVCEVDHIDGDTLFLNELDPSFSYVSTILKVITWATLVLPVAALLISAYYRQTFAIVDLGGFRQMVEDRLKAAKEHHFNFVKWAKEARKNPVPEEEARTKLPRFLSSSSNYAAHLDPLTRIIFSALARIAQEDCSEEDIAFAKFVHKALTAFFMQSEKKNFLEEPSGLYHETLLFSGKNRLQGEDCELHALACFLTRHLRKRIKLLQKEETVKRRVNEAGLDSKVIPFLSLSWLHGTKLSALKNACAGTDFKLHPTGKLGRLGVKPLTGEMENGITAGGFNIFSLSGVNLLHTRMAMDYAKGFRFDLETEKKMIATFLSSKVWEEAGMVYDVDLDPGHMARTLTAMHRVASLDPADFEGKKEAVSQKLAWIDQKIVKVFQDRPNCIFQPVRGLDYMSEFNSLIEFVHAMRKILENPPAPVVMEAEDLEWSKIPVVVASSNRYGIPTQLHLEKTFQEELYPGSLSLKTDIAAVFTTAEHLETVRTYLEDQGLESIAVESMDLLETAAKADNVLSDYYYDVLYRKQPV